MFGPWSYQVSVGIQNKDDSLEQGNLDDTVQNPPCLKTSPMWGCHVMNSSYVDSNFKFLEAVSSNRSLKTLFGDILMNLFVAVCLTSFLTKLNMHS